MKAVLVALAVGLTVALASACQTISGDCVVASYGPGNVQISSSYYTCIAINITPISVTNTSRVDSGSRGATAASVLCGGEVRIFANPGELDSLKGGYTSVAYINARGYTSQRVLIEAMQKAAGIIGANGILLPKTDRPGAGTQTPSANLGTDTTLIGPALAVHYRQCAPAPTDSSKHSPLSRDLLGQELSRQKGVDSLEIASGSSMEFAPRSVRERSEEGRVAASLG